jgi:hypothetical protein
MYWNGGIECVSDSVASIMKALPGAKVIFFTEDVSVMHKDREVMRGKRLANGLW